MAPRTGISDACSPRLNRGASDTPLRGPARCSRSAACKPGFEADLFPATTLLVTANAVTPHAKVWNPRRKRFVRRSLVSRIYFQVGGRTPDFNHNGIDDAIDIEFRHVRDRNKDGVPDRAQR